MEGSGKDDMRILSEGKEIVVEEEFNGRFYSTIKFPIHAGGKPRYLAGYTMDITERRQAEERLKRQEALLETFISQSLDGFFFMMLDEPIEWNDSADKDKLLDYTFARQRMTKVNDAMLAQYGAKREQFIGLTPNDRMAYDIPYSKSLWRTLFDDGRLAVKTSEQKLDGAPMWIEGEYVCMYDSQGRITGHFGIQREITAQKKMEEELWRSEALLSEAQRISHIGSWELDLQTNRLLWSDEIYRIFEMDPQKFDASYEAF
jgi:PAS domain S-box-containing protein